jgi:hypothetical protein
MHICLYIYARKKCDCCLLLSSLSSSSHIPAATFCGCKQALEITTRPYTYFLRQSKGCMFSFTSLIFSLALSLSFFHSCSVFQVLTIDETKCKFCYSFQYIRTFIQSFVPFIESAQTCI